MTHFILCSGLASSGKDTTAKIIKDNLEARVCKVLITHYADLLKFICENFFGWNGEKDEAGRTMLQHIGTNYIRIQYPNYWVDFITNIVKMFPDKWDFVIVSDVRFDSFGDLYKFIATLRNSSTDDVVIYTGYYENEVEDEIAMLKNFKNIIVKFGRFIPNQQPHFDTVLGVMLASDNQYAKKIS